MSSGNSGNKFQGVHLFLHIYGSFTASRIFRAQTCRAAQHQREYGERMAPADGEAVSVEYFLLPEVFRAEVCQGFDYQAVARVLLEHGALLPSSGRAFDCKQRLPGLGLSNCYRIPPALFALDT